MKLAVLVAAALLATAANAQMANAQAVNAQGANSQVVDLSTIKCKEFTELPKETVNAVTVWLDGYLTDEEDPAVVDFDKMKGKVEKLAAFCTANPKMGLMSAAESVMAK